MECKELNFTRKSIKKMDPPKNDLKTRLGALNQKIWSFSVFALISFAKKTKFQPQIENYIFFISEKNSKVQISATKN